MLVRIRVRVRVRVRVEFELGLGLGLESVPTDNQEGTTVIEVEIPGWVKH